MIQFKELETITEGNAIQVFIDTPITDLLTDSRNAIYHNGVLFFAIQGPRNDGHDYIASLYEKGVRQFTIEKKIDLSEFSDANFLLVPNAIEALQKIATFHRNQLSQMFTVAVTGSNGKTTVKEWLYQLVSKYKNTIKSPQSYNSQIGVPLSVWKANNSHELGIFEAGISQPSEMQNLEKIIKPDVGIFTNIGSAHDEGFKNTEEKILEKVALFQNCKTIFYCKDHTEIDRALSQSSSKCFTWGGNTTSDVIVRKYHKNNKGSHIELRFKGVEFSLNLPFTDDASIENCMHCICYMLWQGFDTSQIQGGISELKSVQMRLELKEGINNCLVIDDSYNNDTGGLEVALNFLLQQQQNAKYTLILSDIPQAGQNKALLYKKVSHILKQKKIDRLIGIGANMVENHGVFSMESEFYADTQSFLTQFKTSDFSKETILIKGARFFEFEKVVNKLQSKIHGTVLEIDLNALVHNLNYYRGRLSPDTKIMAMVKAFAYGSGSHEVASLLQYHKVDYLAVAYPDEGVALRQNGIALPIMVMNATTESFDVLYSQELEPEIFSISQLQELIGFLNGGNMKVHLKIDTGMRRLGFEPEDIDGLIQMLRENKNIEIASIFSHIAGADEAMHNAFSSRQAGQFTATYDKIKTGLNIAPIKHLLNSAGILRFPDYHFDMVRLGIGLYGVDANGQHQHQLKNISTLKTTISQIKHINKGETVGYGRMGIATKPSKVATIAIGYADGFSRAFSKGVGEVVIGGKKASVIGNVCMDMTMIDITDIDASEGDEVILFGNQPSILDLAEKIGTIPYEILTNVNERVKRVFFKD